MSDRCQATAKMVLVKDRRLGLLKWVCWLAIFLYIVVAQMAKYGQYFSRVKPTGTVRWQVRSPTGPCDGTRFSVATRQGAESFAIAAFAKQIRLTSAAPSPNARPFWHPPSLPCWYPLSLPRTRPNPSLDHFT